MSKEKDAKKKINRVISEIILAIDIILGACICVIGLMLTAYADMYDYKLLSNISLLVALGMMPLISWLIFIAKMRDLEDLRDDI